MRISSDVGFVAVALIALSLASPVSGAAEDQMSLSVSGSVIGEGTWLVARIEISDATGLRSGVLVRLEPGSSTTVDSMSLSAPGPLRRLRGTLSAAKPGELDYDLELYSGVRLVGAAKGTTSLSEQVGPAD
jgi:hypothetical protein